MANIRNELVQSINALSMNITDEDIVPPVEAPPILPDAQANAALSNQTALLSAIQDLQEQVRDLRHANTGGRGRGRPPPMLRHRRSS